MRYLVLRYSIMSRRRKGRHVAALIRKHGVRTVILVGVGGDGGLVSANERIVESAVGAVAEVLAACDLRATDTDWPYVQADALCLPFKKRAADLVFSNAVIEHVGNEPEQSRFVSEHLRVGSMAVITTPNLWFPVESHTNVIFKHWTRSWRAEREEFTRLLSRRQFRKLLPAEATVIGRVWSPSFVAFIPSSDSRAR